MDLSSANTTLWNGVIQIGIIAGIILLANVLRRKIPFIRRSLMPTAVLGGFVLLIARSLGLIELDMEFMEMLTFHAIGLGFIALSLRIPTKNNASSALIGSKSGAMIVSTYLVQAVIGLVITVALAATVMPGIFKASGILLPMGYGQGPGQSNNIGSSYEALGFTGGRSFALSIAAAGYLCACIVGVVYLNVLKKKGKLREAGPEEDVSGSVTVDAFQDRNEVPISESVDRLSVQAALVALIYLLTYLVTWGICSLLEAVAPGVAGTVSTLLWGFNFIVGSLIAMGCRALFKGLRKVKLMTRQYQNNYLLSRISGLAFDAMIVAGIASIDISDLSGLWLPFLLMTVLGGAGTFVYLKWITKKIYPDYAEEGFVSMFGMLTGTISSGVLLLREIDPRFETPAANNLITGSSFAIAFAPPVLLLVSLAPKSDAMIYVSLGVIIAYFALLMLFIFNVGKKKS